MKFTDGDVINYVRLRRLTETIPTAYTVYLDNSNYRAETTKTDGVDYIGLSGDTAEETIESALSALTAGRTWKEKVVLKGDIQLDLLPVTTNKIGITVPSYTILDCSQAKISMVNSANTNVGKTNFPIRVPLNAHDIELVGGELYGNMAGQPAANEMYGIETDSGTYDIIVRDWYVHDTKETAIAFEGTSHRCWAINNRVINTDEDGIGNQYTAYDIWYINNYVDVGAGAQNGDIFIEGGLNINVIGNTCQGVTDITPNGIKVSRGTATDPIGINLQNNYITNCLYGINVADWVTNTIIEGNHCYKNVGDGIVLSGDNISLVSLIGNHCYDNDQSGSGIHAGILLSGAQYCSVVNCMAYDTQGAGATQGHGISEIGAADHNVIVGCTTIDNITDGIVTVGANSKKNLCWNNGVWIA